MPYAIRKTVVAEGEEPDTFWEALGGKGEYQSEPASSPEPAAHEPQLLLFSEAAPDGLEDLPGYSQDDLDDEAIFLLDAFYTVLALTFLQIHGKILSARCLHVLYKWHHSLCRLSVTQADSAQHSHGHAQDWLILRAARTMGRPLAGVRWLLHSG